MFSTIDQNLFPNECVVLEIEPHARYVYPIFKNGSSSLIADLKFRRVPIDEIKDLSVIEVYVRNPHDRFLSGVQTFVEKLGSEFDKNTILYFVKQYLYLNRHYSPQVYWLMNLARFTDAKFHLLPVDQLKNITSLNNNKSIKDPEIKKYFQDNVKVKFFNEIDETLTVNLINQVVSLSDVMNVVKQNYGTLYQETFGTFTEVNNVLSAT